MKKAYKVPMFALLVSGLALGLSACGRQTTSVPESETAATASSSAVSSGTPVPVVSETAATSTGLETASSSAASTDKKDNNKTDKTMNILSPSEQPDLTKEYSRAILKTSLGDITLKFEAKDAPKTVNNFLYLAKSGFYDGTKFHRVIKDFMIQGGDPLSKDESQKSSWGTGGPGYKFADEQNSLQLTRGALAMANSGTDTNGSQFFIMTAKQTLQLQGYYTVFGSVSDEASQAVADKIQSVSTDGNDRPLEDVTVKSVELLK